jgi:predicted ATPase/DNA-binding CsgD family transcriptional regulator
MGARSKVERAFRSALFLVGFEVMRQPARCQSELARFWANPSADVLEAILLAAAGSQVLDDYVDDVCALDGAELIAILVTHGITGDDAEWVSTLWSPVLAHLRDATVGGPPGTAPNPERNPRPQLTNFLGRARDLQALEDVLARERLITLVGPGGVGKTRLAVEVAARVSARYADGVWTAELAPVEPGSDVVEALAGSLGVRQRGLGVKQTRLGVKHRGLASTTDAVVEWLAPRTVLVVLDNCEHLLDQVSTFVERVLQECPTVTFLLTSREAIGLDGEHCWLTRPLALPPPEVTTPAEAQHYEAIELFVARAVAAARDFVLSADNVGQIAAICRRLDGIPLALELAAARIPAFGPADLLEHLDERFQLLSDSRRAPRRTLRGTVDWSYELLDELQRVLFRRLSVFAGSWSLDACRTVCTDPELHPSMIVEVLAELIAKSLVTMEVGPSGTTRYLMLETLREYGQERLDSLGEGDGVRRRHAQWARSLVERLALGLKGPNERASGDLIRVELDNLRIAMRWAITNDDAEIAFGIIGSLENYAILRLDFEVAAWAEQSLATDAWIDHPQRNLAFGLVAHAAWARGDHERARQLGEEALSVERRHGSGPSWVARQAIADAAWFRGWTDEAMHHFADWVERARRHGDDFDLSWPLAHLAVAESVVGGAATDHTSGDEALALARRCGSPFLIALALYAKSECMIDENPVLAMKQVAEGVAIGSNSGDRFAYGLCLTTFASLTGRLGDPTEALSLYRSAVENWRVAGNWTNQRILLRNLAEFAARIGEFELTARLLAALEASGDMLEAGAGPEGERLADAIDRARRGLGDGYDEIARDGGQIHPVALVRDTLQLIDRAIARAGTPVGGSGSSAPGGLSPREQEVVALVATGRTNREIADRLFISERTVDTHITRIRRKLGTTTRTQLAVWGLENGATRLPRRPSTHS